MAIGIIKERHSPELHQKLFEALNQNPEEDVEILVLDKEFKVIAQARTTSDLMPPTLLNEGQINLLAQPTKRYRLAMMTWGESDGDAGTIQSAMYAGTVEFCAGSGLGAHVRHAERFIRNFAC